MHRDALEVAPLTGPTGDGVAGDAVDVRDPPPRLGGGVERVGEPAGIEPPEGGERPVVDGEDLVDLPVGDPA